jgi:hypothetical protein
MDTQQMMEILLSRMDANMKAMNEKMNELKKDGKIDREEMIARMDANTIATLATLEMADEIKETNRARTKVMQDKRMKANIDTCSADRKESTAYQDAMEANLEKMEPNPGEKRPQWRGRKLLTKK